MASSKQFKDFIFEQLRYVQNISCRQMMGEFLLYCDGVLFGGIYDDKLLIKKTDSNKRYNLQEHIPYKNAKPMYMVDNLEDTDYLKELIEITLQNLSIKKGIKNE